MRWIDITRPLSSETAVYPGDPPVEIHTDEYELYRVSRFSMSVHAGTHIDAPAHFLRGGATTDEIPLSNKMNGRVMICPRDLDWLGRLVGCERLLLRGGPGLSAGEARAVADAGVQLVGTDQISIGRFENERDTHCALLSAGVCVLENCDLTDVPDGEGTLVCLPMRLHHVEGAPVRALVGVE